MIYERLDQFPDHIQAWVLRRLTPDDPEQWAKLPVPALGNESPLDVMNGQDGEQRIIAFLNRLPDCCGPF